MTHITRAKAIARIAHHGVVDKAGKPYFGHAERVARGPYTYLLIDVSVGYLHDVLEDTHITARDLEDLGVGGGIINIVEILTRGRGEDYFDYIARIAKNPVATRVKLNDLTDNLDESRWPDMPDSMKARYLKAKSILEENANG
jgi:(p)ppGpp synthase/HD superfamily hydrolase